MAVLTKDLESLFQRLLAISDTNDKLVLSALVSHATSHQFGGADQLNVGNLPGRLADSQFVTLQDSAGVPQGQAHTLKITGQASIAVLAGVATLTVASTPVVDASSSVKGISKLSVNPLSPTDPIAVGENDPRLPTQSENDALAGTLGIPSASNRYVTDSDLRMTNSRTPLSHAASHQDGGSDQLVVTGLLGRLADSQFLTFKDEGASKGQAFIVNFTGAGVTVNNPVSGEIEVVIPGGGGSSSLEVHEGASIVTSPTSVIEFDPIGFNLTQPSLGHAKVDLNFGAIAGTVTQGNDSRLPTQAIRDALEVVGVGSFNKFIADDDIRLSNARTPSAHGPSHQDGGSDELVVTGLAGVLAEAQKVEILEEAVSEGLATKLNFTGAGVDVSFSSGTATITITSAGVSVLSNDILVAAGVGLLDFSPSFVVTEAPTGEANIAALFGTASATFAEGNDARFPTADQKAALVGTDGTPSATNKYVTNSDPRLAPFTLPSHAASHQDGGTDELNVGNLSGVLADLQKPKLDQDILANRPAAALAGRLFRTTDEKVVYRDSGSLWEKIAVTDYADLDGIPSSFVPAGHGASHQDGGSDELNVAGLAGRLAGSQFVEVFDDGVSEGLAHTFDVIGPGLSVSVAGGIATLTAVPQAPASHASTHQAGGTDQLSVEGLGGRLVGSQFVEVKDENVSQGLAHTFNFVGGGVSSSVTAGVATVTITGGGGSSGTITVKNGGSAFTDISILDFDNTMLSVTESPTGEANVTVLFTDASTSAKGYTKLSVAPASPTDPIAAGTNDPRIPLQAENDALQGTSGTPSNSNRYVTDTDIRNTNARTPLLHVATHQAGGTDELLHNTLGGLTLGDPHTQYILVDASRSFTNPITAPDPTSAGHLATRNYVDTQLSVISGRFAPAVQTLANLAAVAPADRQDKQVRLVEDAGAFYRFDAQALSGDVTPDVGTGFWFKTSAATQDHASLLNLLGDGPEYVHLSLSQKNSLTGGANSGLHFHDSDRARANHTGTQPVSTLSDFVSAAHALIHENGGGAEINVGGLSGVLADAQRVDVQDEGSSVGLATILNFVGGGISATFSSGTATITVPGVTALAVKDGTTTIASAANTLSFNDTAFTVTESPANQANITPVFGSAAGTFTEGNDARLPTANEKAALAGAASGTAPTGSNRFVVNDDTRLPLQAENDALVGTSGTPSSTNKYVTDADPRVPSQDENDALQGTNGTPSGSNRYVTNTDPRNSNSRAPTSHASSHQDGGSDELNVADLLGRLAEAQFVNLQDEGGFQGLIHTINFVGAGVTSAAGSGTATVTIPGQTVPDASSTVKGVTRLSVNPLVPTIPIAVGDNDGRVPTQSENDALQGTQGSPSNTNRFVTDQDSRLIDARPPTTHATSHQAGGTDVLNVANLAGRLTDSQFVSIREQGTPEGQAHTLNFTGAAVGSITISSGVATINLIDSSSTLTIEEGGSSVVTPTSFIDFAADAFNITDAGSGRASVALSFGATATTPAAGNDARFPSADQKAALAGTNGTPSNANRYVTNSDARNTNARTPTLHAASHQDGGADELVVTGLSGQLADRQKVRVQDESVDVGEVDTIDFQGAGVSVSMGAGKAVVTITGGGGGSSLTVQEGDVTVVGAADTMDFDAAAFNITSGPAGEANVALNFGTGVGTVCPGNDARLSDARKPNVHRVDLLTHITPAIFRAPAASRAARAGTTNTSTILPVYEFSGTQQEYFVTAVRIPLDLDVAGTVRFHLDWLPTTTPASADGVRWVVELALVDLSLDVALSSIQATAVASTTADTMTQTTISDTVGNLSLVADRLLIVHVSRNPAHAGDVLVGGAQLGSLVVEFPLV